MNTQLLDAPTATDENRDGGTLPETPELSALRAHMATQTRRGLDVTSEPQKIEKTPYHVTTMEQVAELRRLKKSRPDVLKYFKIIAANQEILDALKKPSRQEAAAAREAAKPRFAWPKAEAGMTQDQYIAKVSAHLRWAAREAKEGRMQPVHITLNQRQARLLDPVIKELENAISHTPGPLGGKTNGRYFDGFFSCTIEGLDEAENVQAKAVRTNQYEWGPMHPSALKDAAKQTVWAFQDTSDRMKNSRLVQGTKNLLGGFAGRAREWFGKKQPAYAGAAS